jgi:hypothetical protein
VRTFAAVSKGRSLRPNVAIWPHSIDKSALVLATPRRYRNREHLRYVAQQACLVCGRNPMRIIFATCNRGRSAAK